MIVIPQDKASQLIRVAQRRQRAINQPDDLADSYLRRSTAQFVAAFCAPYAFHHAGIPQFNQDQLQKLFRQIPFGGDVSNLDNLVLMLTRKRHHRL